MGVIFLKNILVIEDDKTLAKAIKLRLETAGFRVVTENQGLPALTFAAEHPLDLVILDIKLPDINGFDVCARLRKLHGPWLPILMLTGMDKPVDQIKGFSHGADAYLTKPYKPVELLKTVELLLGSDAGRPKAPDRSYLSIEDVARRFGVNTTTVYRLAQRGALPGFKVGAQWRFSLDLLESWMADQVTLEWLQAENRSKVFRAHRREAHGLKEKNTHH